MDYFVVAHNSAEQHEHANKIIPSRKRTTNHCLNLKYYIHEGASPSHPECGNGSIGGEERRERPRTRARSLACPVDTNISNTLSFNREA
mmetsp:Transcript_35478/g.49255  ORF Transcript_35478/g.49255 Transcript_35478/m.49255 type:complete len:89 (-) Transcript_35478:53-319(-)